MTACTMALTEWGNKFLVNLTVSPTYLNDWDSNVQLSAPPSSPSDAECAELLKMKEEEWSRKEHAITRQAKTWRAAVDPVIAHMDPYALPMRHATIDMLEVLIQEIVAPVFQLKARFGRGRPGRCCKGKLIDPMFKGTDLDPVHAAYPSGHATQAHAVALLFGSIQPGLSSRLSAAAGEVARNREVAGLHYRSDSDAGRLLAEQLVRLLLANPRFKADFYDRAVKEWP